MKRKHRGGTQTECERIILQRAMARRYAKLDGEHGKRGKRGKVTQRGLVP